VRGAGLSGRKVVSADRHIVRVWDALSGEGFTSVQPAEPGINDVLLWPDAGLLMLGMDAPRIQARRPAARQACSADRNLKLRARAATAAHRLWRRVLLGRGAACARPAGRWARSRGARSGRARARPLVLRHAALAGRRTAGPSPSPNPITL